jgi:uncharacterized Tic20 family protein
MSVGPISVTENRDERMWAALVHVVALSLFIGIPFGNLIGPLIIWLIKKDQYPFVDQQGKESINFQISMTIYAIISGILVFVVVGIFLLVAIALIDIVLAIIAAVEANQGRPYQYPLTIRFVR